jgi:hypothetical protein
MVFMRRKLDERFKIDAQPEDALAAILEGAGAESEDFEEPEGDDFEI